MTFVLRMAWREIRAAWLRLVFFFLCVAVGVAAIVLLRSVVQTVRTTLVREARSLIGGDLAVQSTRPLTADEKAALDRQLAIPDIHGRMDIVETQTMAGKIGPSGLGRSASSNSAASNRRIRSTGRSSCRAARRFRMPSSRTTACWFSLS